MPPTGNLGHSVGERLRVAKFATKDRLQRVVNVADAVLAK